MARFVTRLLFILALGATLPSAAQMLPQVVTREMPNLTLRGDGVMRFFGLKVYDVRLWSEEMARIFPDIKKGDTLIGVSIPGKEARFYNRDKFIASVTDPEFARAFFDIWLSEKTSAPAVRAKLLGSP